MSVVYILTLCCLVSCGSRERATSCGSLIVVLVYYSLPFCLCEMCVTVIYFLLVKLIKFFSLSFYILLPVIANKDFHTRGPRLHCVEWDVKLYYTIW